MLTVEEIKILSVVSKVISNEPDNVALSERYISTSIVSPSLYDPSELEEETDIISVCERSIKIVPVAVKDRLLALSMAIKS